MSRLHRTNLARTAVPRDEEALRAFRSQFRSGPIMRHFLRPVALAVLVMSLLLGMLSVVAEVTLDDRWFFLAPLLFLVTLEAVYTTNWLYHPDRLPLDRTAYRGAELLLIMVIVRLVSWFIFDGGLPGIQQLWDYVGNPLPVFLNGPFLASLLLTLIGWRLAVALGEIFNDLEVNEFELRFYSLPLAQRKAQADDQPIYAARSQKVRNFGVFWIWGGVLLAISVGLATLDVRSPDFSANPLAWGGNNLTPLHLLILLVYFMLGFWLLSQAKLMELNARWLVNGITKDTQMEGKWQRLTLGILILVGLGAAFLPTGPTLTISRIVNAALYLLLVLVNLLIFLIFLPIAFFLSLFPNRSGGELAPPPIVPTEALTRDAPAGQSPLGETIAMVLSSGFWSVLIVVIVLALLFFLRERRSSMRENWTRYYWTQLRLLWSTLWERLRRRAEAIRLQLPVRLRRPEGDAESPESTRRWRFIRVSGLSPRDQLRYFYLSTVRRASDQGVERKSAETPLEFSEDLKANWPEVEDKVEALTGAFLKARYSDAPIKKGDVPDVKDTWKDVRRQIRKTPTTTEEESSPDAEDQ